jgi:ADP-heptose:LPS heptosyltransferase
MIRRYEGQDLGPAPRIAVLGSTKLGNFIVTTPLLRGLKERFPDSTLDFYGSPVNRAFEEACPWVDWRTEIFPLSPDRLQALAAAAGERAGEGGYALVVNCDGFNPYTTTLAALFAPTWVAGWALGPDLSEPLPLGDHPNNRILAEPDWTTPAFLERYRGHLSSNYIGELFGRMAFVDTDYFAISLESEEPPFEVPDVLVHANATRDAKLWPAEAWTPVLDWCRDRGLSVGLVGVLPKPGREGEAGYPIEAALAEHAAVTDLRGQTTPIQLAGALKAARACVTVDSGPLHVAAAVGCPTVALFGNDAQGVGASPLALWMPRVGNVARAVSEHSCTLCLDNRFKNGGCLKAEHECMLGVRPDVVIRLLEDALAAGPHSPATAGDPQPGADA